VRTVALINMRCDYSFSYVRAPPTAPASTGVVLAEISVPLESGLADSPTQGMVFIFDQSCTRGYAIGSYAEAGAVGGALMLENE
jgi:hypothetical protein